MNILRFPTERIKPKRTQLQPADVVRLPKTLTRQIIDSVELPRRKIKKVV